MMQKTITVKSLNKIKKEFEQNKVLTRNFISKKLSIHYYAVCLGFEELERQGFINKINASSKGVLFISTKK